MNIVVIKVFVSMDLHRHGYSVPFRYYAHIMKAKALFFSLSEVFQGATTIFSIY